MVRLMGRRRPRGIVVGRRCGSEGMQQLHVDIVSVQRAAAQWVC